jgi:hypothetical protein
MIFAMPTNPTSSRRCAETGFIIRLDAADEGRNE